MYKEFMDLRQRCVASPSRAGLLAKGLSAGGQPPCFESCNVSSAKRQLVAPSGTSGMFAGNLTCGKDRAWRESGHGEHSWFSTVLQRQSVLQEPQCRQEEPASPPAENCMPHGRNPPSGTTTHEMHQGSGAQLQMARQRLLARRVPASLEQLRVKSDGSRRLPGSSECLSTCMQENCSKTAQRLAVSSSMGRSRSRRSRCYGEAERRAATPFIAKVMEAADFNSNVTGGAAAFKRLIREAQSLGPQKAAIRLGEVLRVFKSNTPGKHGMLLDEIIVELEQGSRHEAAE